VDDLARQKLRDIVKTYGRGICEEPRRVKGLLLDHCGRCRGEINVLMIALHENVPNELLKGTRSMPEEGVILKLTRRLEAGHYLTEEAAYWAVETWAWALGMRIKKSVARRFQAEARTRDAAPPNADPPAAPLATPVDPASDLGRRMGPFLKPLSQRGMSRMTVYLTALIGLVYILNPIPGGVDLIPDIIPIIGNLDDGAAAILVWYGLVELFEGRKFRKP
jgi:hypothetical protein